MDARRVIAGAGRVLINLGVLILLFVAYQLWGTGLREAQAQRDLKDDFQELLGQPSPTTTSTTAGVGSSTTSTSTTRVPAPPPAPEGQAVAIIKIPKLDIEKAVVHGVGVSDLKKGPGHYPDTPLPGQPGNAAIAGHRTTYGAPFYRLDELQPGDPILVTTRQGRFRYEVSESKVVAPTEVSVLDPTPDNRLTLTTCHPRFSARQRLIVVATLVGEAADPPPPPPETQGGEDRTSPTTIPGEQTPETRATIDGDEAGLSGDPAARWPTLLWGLVTASVYAGVWLAGRLWRRWPAYVLGTPAFLVVLYFFFESFARLLPANV